MSRTGESKLRVKVNFLWHISICTSTRRMLFLLCLQRNSRKCNDLNKSYDPSRLSFKSMQRFTQTKSIKRRRHVDSCLTSSSFSVCDLSRHMLMAKLLFSSSSSFTLKTQNPVHQYVFVFTQRSAGHPWRNSFGQMSAVYAVAPRPADYPQKDSLFSMQIFICSLFPLSTQAHLCSLVLVRVWI